MELTAINLATIWDRVFQPVPMICIGLLIGCFIGGIIVQLLFWKTVKEKLKEIDFDRVENGVSNSVLNIVQVGVVAFTDNGTLLFNNKTCLKKLKVNKVPTSFTEFVETFIKDPEVLMKLRLYESSLPQEKPTETEEENTENEKIEAVTTRVEINNRIIQFHFSKPYYKTAGARGWVVVLEDVTKADRQEQQRRLFVSTVSHELKTPLSTIMGYSEDLIHYGVRNETREKIFSDVMKINEDAHRLESIIANLTFLSQIENNKEKIRMELYRIVPTVQEVIRQYQEASDKKNIQISFVSLTGKMPLTYGCPSMMQQMVGNLINNAIKYSPEYTNIWVYIQAHENTITIKVQDQGPGIPKPAAEKVFQAFFRVDETGSRMAGGSGLGLAIVRMIAEVMEGQVSLVTRTENDEETENMRSEVGSDFYITVPTAAAVFRETLAGISAGAEREELLYRQAQKYIEKVNQDEYDLGFDLKTLKDKKDVDLIISRLVFMDECDIIDEADSQYAVSPKSADAQEGDQIMASVQADVPMEDVPPVPPMPEPVVEVPQVQEVVSQPQEVIPPVPEPVAEMPQVPEVLQVPEVVPQMQVSEPVPEVAKVPDLPAEQVVPAAPVAEMPVTTEQSAPSVQAEELVSLSSQKAKMLVPDPPVLKRPLLSKDQIGMQNAQNRRHAGAKKNAAKKEPVSVKKEEPKEEAKASAVPATRSLLRQLTDPSHGKNTDKDSTGSAE